MTSKNITVKVMVSEDGERCGCDANRCPFQGPLLMGPDLKLWGSCNGYNKLLELDPEGRGVVRCPSCFNNEHVSIGSGG